MSEPTQSELREMARALVKGSIIEDAASQFIAHIIRHVHEERIAPLKTRIATLEAQLALIDEAEAAREATDD